MIVHALLDFSEIDLTTDEWSTALALLRAGDGVTGLASQVTCILPARAPRDELSQGEWRAADTPGVNAATDAIGKAGRAYEHLLVMRAPLATAIDAIGELPAVFQQDPMFGSVHPRFSAEPGGGVFPVFRDDANRRVIARGALLDAPDCYIATEYISPCFVLRRELVANLDPTGGTSVRELLFNYLRRARRVGYRSAIANRVSVALGPYVDSLHVVDAGVALESHADTQLARHRFSRGAEAQREERLSALHVRPRPVLIDARNLGPTINGTTKALLGLTDALFRANTGWDITLSSSDEAIRAHDLSRRYPDWTLTDALPQRPFAVAFRPSQPWDLTELKDLHALAAINIYLMLDTIAWDIVYTAPPRLDATWTFAAQYADALLFISDFSRQRFAARFAVHPGVEMGVCHLSLDPAEYVDPRVEILTGEPFWFVVGNHYDHKHVAPTLALLARAFPTTKLAVLGSKEARRYLMALPSGRADERTVQSLYASASLVIFPSMYEGFGLPVVNALAYGTTVVARDSELMREIASSYVGPGRLILYSTPDELVRYLTHLRHGRPVPDIPLGTGRSSPSGWGEAAATVVACVERLIQARSSRRERDRHTTITLLDSWVTT